MQLRFPTGRGLLRTDGTSWTGGRSPLTKPTSVDPRTRLAHRTLGVPGVTPSQEDLPWWQSLDPRQALKAMEVDLGFSLQGWGVTRPFLGHHGANLLASPGSETVQPRPLHGGRWEEVVISISGVSQK